MSASGVDPVSETFARDIARAALFEAGNADWQHIPMPAPLSVNNLFANVAGRGRVRTQRYLTWLNSAGWHVRKVHPKRINGRCEVMIVIPRATRCDIDNCAKAYLDALVTFGVLPDDRLIQSLIIRREDVPSAVICLRSLA